MEAPYVVYHEQVTPASLVPAGDFLKAPWKIAETPFEHVKHYASSIFEGIRVVWDPKREKFYAICLKEHVERFFDSMRFMNLCDHDEDVVESSARIKDPTSLYYPYDKSHVLEKILETITANIKSGIVGKDGCYVRPNMYRGDLVSNEGELVPTFGLAPLQRSVVFEIMAKPWGRYLAKPPRVIVSPKGIDYEDRRKKCGGNYALAARLKSWAERNDFNEALLTDPSSERNVLELTGQNLFGFKGGRIITPSLDQCVLPGTKRAIIIKMSRDLGIEVVERHIPLQEFIECDAGGCSGTASGMVELGSVVFGDSHSNFRENEVLRMLIDQYDRLIAGETVDKALEGLQEKVRTAIDF